MSEASEPQDTGVITEVFADQALFMNASLGRVLVVDDNAVIRIILSKFLQKLRIKFDVANNGEEAIEKWQAGGFNLIFMNTNMSVMNGVQAIKEIRRLEAISCSAPVNIVALAFTPQENINYKAAMAAGCNDFLLTPLRLMEVKSKLIEWGVNLEVDE